MDARTEKTELSSRAWALHRGQVCPCVQASSQLPPKRRAPQRAAAWGLAGEGDPQGPQPEPVSGGPSRAAQLPARGRDSRPQH